MSCCHCCRLSCNAGMGHQRSVPGRLWAGAVPGPLFTFAAYLGAVMGPAPNGVAGAIVALVALLFPGMLLVYGMLPFWDAMRTRPAAQAAMRGTNAAVVGILGAALYNPVWTSAVLNPRDFALALTGFLFLTVWKAPPWIVVRSCRCWRVVESLGRAIADDRVRYRSGRCGRSAHQLQRVGEKIRAAEIA